MKIEFASSGDSNDKLISIDVAKALIEHESTYTNFLGLEQIDSTFSIEDLEEIANHLLVYCKCERMRNGYTEEQK